MGIVNEIKDARVAERSDLSKEAKAAHRFVALKKRNLKKKKFNLDENDESDNDEGPISYHSKVITFDIFRL